MLFLDSFVVEIFVNSCVFGGGGRAGSHSFSELHDTTDPASENNKKLFFRLLGQYT